MRLFPQMRRRPRLSRLILEAEGHCERYLRVPHVLACPSQFSDAEAEDHIVGCATKQSGFDAMPSVVIVSHQTHVGEKRQPYNRDRKRPEQIRFILRATPRDAT